ncbi:MAG: CvpA family protein [Chloroflexia bacterium]|nr:CvpA family protein [Chloroflexia bacterium]
MSIAPLDIAIITLVGFFAVRGIRRGFVRGVLDLVVLVVAIRGGALLGRPVADAMAELGFGEATPAIAFAVATIAAGLAGVVAIALVTRPLRRLPVPPPLPFLDGLFGLAPGMVKGIAAAIALMLPLAAFQTDLGLADEVRASRLAPSLYSLGRQASVIATRQFGFELPPVDPATNAPPLDLPFPRVAPPRFRTG